MKVLVTGGYGALGYDLLRSLHNTVDSYEVAGLDNFHDFDFEYDFPEEMYDKKFDPIEIIKAVDWADVIVHMAEDNNPLTEPNQALYNNVSTTMELLTMAATKGKRVVVPCWLEFSGDAYVSPWDASIVWRQQIAHMFHQGNAVINTVSLPRIISPYHHDMTFGNLVKRFYRAIINDEPADITRGELDDDARWCTSGSAIRSIVSAMRRRTRASAYVHGEGVSTQAIAEYMAWKLNVERIEVREPKAKVMRTAFANDRALDNVIVQGAVNSCIEVWNA
jgi:nucleoside-diphosphate-sugar epimerase